MFTGDLIRINGVSIPNRYIDVKTYTITPSRRRVIDSYFDGNGKRHIVYSPHTTTKIEFNTNGLMMAAMRSFLTYFPTTEGLSIVFYNDKTDTYESGIFRLENEIVFGKYRLRGNNIIYKSINISLEED
jgi:hypothetical protein